MSYLHPGLLWIGLPLIALPVLIHLINMMRHRKIQWAAMEFLLVSQKKNRKWVMLKQFLLLLMRMAAVAAVAFMVAQPQVRNRLGTLFGGSKTHHIVLLDDSFSMSDRWADTSAFDEAKKRIQGLVKQAQQQQAQQEFTLLRFSKAGKTGRGMQPDMSSKPMSVQFEMELETALAGMKVSELSVGPSDALDSALQLIESNKAADAIVYLVSDYRVKEWNEAGDLRKRLADLNEVGVEPKLIACVDAARPNLAITSLRPLPGTRAAGVNLVMEVTVKNFGADRVRDVSVLLEEDGKPRPAETIEQLNAGASQSRTFEVKFTTAGQHRVSARLQADAVGTDDSRYTVVDFVAGVPVLIIEGDPKSVGAKGSDSFFVSQAISPDLALTGVRPQIETPQFLRTTKEPLDKFHAIYLLNVERLQESELAALEEYAKRGGGVAFFVGDRVAGKFYNDKLYRAGEGIFPIPLVDPPVGLPVDRLEKSPDLEISVHPIFGKFAGDRNPFITAVNIERYFAAPRNWKPTAGSTAKVIARLRNGAPLMVEQAFGDGRVVAVLTTAAPNWNNWGRANPSYIVTLQQLQAYLSTWKQTDPSRQVGTPLKVELTGNYTPEVGFVTPLEGAAGMFTTQAKQEADKLSVELDNTDKSGIYEARLSTVDGKNESLQFAFNVVPTEGDLAIVSEQQLADKLDGIVYQFFRAGDVGAGGKEFGQNLSETILYLLVAILIGEQLLAYSASYHTPLREAAR